MTINVEVPPKTINVHIDGWPFLIQFYGKIEIARMESGNVAIRLESDDAALVSCGLGTDHTARRKGYYL
jgi:hypothetical protein